MSTACFVLVTLGGLLSSSCSPPPTVIILLGKNSRFLSLSDRYLASSMVTGLVVTTAMNPFDVISTRLYTQGTGVAERYTGPLDCAVKTVRAEGFRGVSRPKASKRRGAAGDRWATLVRSFKWKV